MQNQSNEVNASSCIIYSSDFTPLYPDLVYLDHAFEHTSLQGTSRD
ncbi:hypothetical protein NC653_040256 [Populus alba x Populus x berolinensis]|uniref:Uncharacterized protein n=1 Tax=Populus alba x Populus x berolinensis TaxID=444605 RepID=A0AAD6LDS3_9ROSI|nr:hypothetical protein NC653_040256 [Populus alba x Populus x berolinensis]